MEPPLLDSIMVFYGQFYPSYTQIFLTNLILGSNLTSLRYSIPWRTEICITWFGRIVNYVNFQAGLYLLLSGILRGIFVIELCSRPLPRNPRPSNGLTLNDLFRARRSSVGIIHQSAHLFHSMGASHPSCELEHLDWLHLCRGPPPPPSRCPWGLADTFLPPGPLPPAAAVGRRCTPGV